MFTRGYHGISIVLSVLALLLCPLFHPCTGERNVFIWVSENCSYTYTSTRIYAAYIYIYIHTYAYNIYIYTPHRCILFMYVFCIFVMPAAQKSSAIFMYVLCTFLVGHGCENGVFLPQIQAFSKGIYGNHFDVKPLHFGVSHTFQTQPVACWFGADAWCAYALPDHWNPYFGIFLSQFHLHILLHILDHSI